MTAKKLDLSIVIVSYNTIELLRACLMSIGDVVACQNDFSTEVIVVDNGSVDGSISMVRDDFPWARLLAMNKNLGFGLANNVGVTAAEGEFLLLINSDTVIHSDVGMGLVGYLRGNPNVSCVAPRVVLPDGTPQPKVFGNLPTPWRVLTQNLGLNRVFSKSNYFSGIDSLHWSERATFAGWVSGVCMCLRRTDYLKIGGFDPRFFMYCEDIEFCWRIDRNIGAVVRLDEFPVLHFGGASSKSVAAKLRNSVWQQRNLLLAIRIHQGHVASAISRLVMTPGLMLRLGAGILLVFAGSARNTFLLRSAWLRLLDLGGLLRKLPD
jgi:GT2 family glycosyltransferase